MNSVEKLTVAQLSNISPLTEPKAYCRVHKGSLNPVLSHKDPVNSLQLVSLTSILILYSHLYIGFRS